MGCFDSTCCLTDLPISSGDPVMAGILIENEREGFQACYVGDQYQFFALPIQSTYNDYGSIDHADVSAGDKRLLKFMMKIYRHGIFDHERYSRDILKGSGSIAPEELWDCCFNSELEWDPDRPERQQKANQPTRIILPRRLLYPWMCHKWAWDAMLEMSPFDPGLDRHIDIVLAPRPKVMSDPPSMKGKLTEKQVEDLVNQMTTYSTEFSGSSWHVSGDQAGISRTLIDTVRYTQNKISSQVSKSLRDAYRDTLHVNMNSYFTRRILQPMSTFGEQHCDCSLPHSFHQLVADKAKEIATADVE